MGSLSLAHKVFHREMYSNSSSNSVINPSKVSFDFGYHFLPLFLFSRGFLPFKLLLLEFRACFPCRFCKNVFSFFFREVKRHWWPWTSAVSTVDFPPSKNGTTRFGLYWWVLVKILKRYGFSFRQCRIVFLFLPLGIKTCPWISISFIYYIALVGKFISRINVHGSCIF